MEYTVLINKDLDELIIQVNQHIKKGWEPLGGVADGSLNQGDFVLVESYSQAMIKR